MEQVNPDKPLNNWFKTLTKSDINCSLPLEIAIASTSFTCTLIHLSSLSFVTPNKSFWISLTINMHCFWLCYDIYCLMLTCEKSTRVHDRVKFAIHYMDKSSSTQVQENFLNLMANIFSPHQLCRKISDTWGLRLSQATVILENFLHLTVKTFNTRQLCRIFSYTWGLRPSQSGSCARKFPAPNSQDLQYTAAVQEIFLHLRAETFDTRQLCRKISCTPWISNRSTVRNVRKGREGGWIAYVVKKNIPMLHALCLKGGGT